MTKASQISLPLQKDFRYFHEPPLEELTTRWAVGRDALVREFADRIVFLQWWSIPVEWRPRGWQDDVCAQRDAHHPI